LKIRYYSALILNSNSCGGCPIIFSKDNESFVIGIHVAKKIDSLRRGRLMTDDLVDWLIIWSKEMNLNPPIFQNMKVGIIRSKR
jgi:hypothetical protein